MQGFERLEEAFGKWSNTKNVVACSSGTSALHLALEAFRFPLGSEVLVPEYAMIACARAVTMAGLVPVFVDCKDDLLIDTELLEERVTSKTVAIMPVHTYGRRCDMVAISDFSNTYGLVVVEDLAEGHGIPVHGGTHAACWSFYQNKIVAGEEGGAISFRIQVEADYAKKLRSVGFTEDHNFLHHPRGFNARLSNANAILVLDSLLCADHNLEERERVVADYNFLLPSKWRMPKRDVCWVYDIKIPGVNLDKVVRACNELGVAARHGFKTMSQQLEYRIPSSEYQNLNSYKLSKEVMYLPVYPNMDIDDCKKNVEVLKAAVAE